MRKLFIVTAFAAFAAGFAGEAVANYFYPGRVIIGTGISGGTGSTTTSAAAGGEGCVIVPAIECECFPGVPVLEACIHTQVDIGCLTPDTDWEVIIQKEPVVFADPSQTLGGVICTGQSKQTALISLPKY